MLIYIYIYIYIYIDRYVVRRGLAALGVGNASWLKASFLSSIDDSRILTGPSTNRVIKVARSGGLESFISFLFLSLCSFLSVCIQHA